MLYSSKLPKLLKLLFYVKFNLETKFSNNNNVNFLFNLQTFFYSNWHISSIQNRPYLYTLLKIRIIIISKKCQKSHNLSFIHNWFVTFFYHLLTIIYCHFIENQLALIILKNTRFLMALNILLIIRGHSPNNRRTFP